MRTDSTSLFPDEHAGGSSSKYHATVRKIVSQRQVGMAEKQCAAADTPSSRKRQGRHLARLVLTVFLLTFFASRIVVLLIMSRTIPDFFLHLGGTHVHHLNYGIFLLSAVGGYLVFTRPDGRAREVAAVVYAIGLALTFDEFGMWLHLGGGYWQRASYDAIVVIAGIIALIAFAPALRDWHRRNAMAAIAVGVGSVLFFGLLIHTLSHLERRVEPRLEHLEQEGPA